MPDGNGRIYKDGRLVMDANFEDGIIKDRLTVILEDGLKVHFQLKLSFPIAANFEKELDGTKRQLIIQEFEERSWVPNVSSIKEKICAIINGKEEHSMRPIDDEQLQKLLKYLDFLKESYTERFNHSHKTGTGDTESCFASFYDPFGVIVRFNVHLKVKVKKKKLKKRKFGDINYSAGFTTQFTEFDKIHKHTVVNQKIDGYSIFMSKLSFVAILGTNYVGYSKKSYKSSKILLKNFSQVHKILLANKNDDCIIVDFMGNTFSGSI